MTKQEFIQNIDAACKLNNHIKTLEKELKAIKADIMKYCQDKGIKAEKTCFCKLQISDKTTLDIDLVKLHRVTDINTFISCVTPSVTEIKKTLSAKDLSYVSKYAIKEYASMSFKTI